jgi:phenylpropionate dioxygenase-like ring-hydroxylating dioxygenase large terminal subunit
VSIRFPATSFPTGWFQVGFGHDLAAGEVRPLEYFGKKLVMWRGESGEVFVQNAFCLHLGAHRGVGGWVSGDDLTCPWHGWQWNGEGRNTCIPYSAERCKPKLQIETFPAQEWCGLILVWHDWAGGPPTWEPPKVPEFEDADFYPMHPFSDRVHRVRAHPQMPIENAVDPAHIPYIHGAAETPRVLQFITEDHYCRSDVEVLYGGGKGATGITESGGQRAVVQMGCYGIGLSVIRWDDALVPTVQITAFTPVDGEYIDYYFMQTSVRTPGDTGDEPTGPALDMLKVQWKVIEQDFFTWENMTYLQTPNFAIEEAKHYAAMRRWATQFYPAEEGAGMIPLESVEG